MKSSSVWLELQEVCLSQLQNLLEAHKDEAGYATFDMDARTMTTAPFGKTYRLSSYAWSWLKERN